MFKKINFHIYLKFYMNLFPDCGVTVTKKIVGGSTAAKGKWPWQILMLVRYRSNRVKLCGGVIISRNCVLTAAHCVDEV